MAEVVVSADRAGGGRAVEVRVEARVEAVTEGVGAEVAACTAAPMEAQGAGTAILEAAAVAGPSEVAVGGVGL